MKGHTFGNLGRTLSAMDLTQIIADLESVGERLNDMMFDVLREASREGNARPDSDKELMKAQRAVDKAVHVLKGLES